MGSRFLPSVLCLMLASGGCARTDDGTVVIPRPLDARRIWDRGPSPPQTPPLQADAGVFPVAPQASHRRAARPAAKPARHGKRLRRPALAKETASPEPTKPLACRSVDEPGKRVRVVCD